MLTTVAVLIIVLGLMVSLARYVRDRSAQQLTREELKELETLMAQYVESNAGQMPAVDPILPGDAAPEESALADAARRNNAQCVRALKADYRARLHDLGTARDPFEQLPISVYDRLSVRDAWGSPIVFMPGQHKLIGLAPSKAGQDQYFFFSAGPDRNYLSRDDNVYSYEAAESK